MLGGVSPVELNGMNMRTQDFSAIKHHEDAKVNVDQGNFNIQVEKKTEQKSSTVIEGQKAETHGESQGNGSAYAGDGGRNRKRKSDVPDDGRVVVKRQGGFDMSI